MYSLHKQCGHLNISRTEVNAILQGCCGVLNLSAESDTGFLHIKYRTLFRSMSDGKIGGSIISVSSLPAASQLMLGEAVM
jgi:hypothetical protein